MNCTSPHHALERDEFILHYQPQINVATGAVVQMEALLRWQHPLLGLVAPSQFIPLAEENGLIVAIGEWVLQTACIQVMAWHRASLPLVKLAVNLSARQLQHPNLVNVVAKVLADTGFPSTHLAHIPHFQLAQRELNRGLNRGDSISDRVRQRIAGYGDAHQ